MSQLISWIFIAFCRCSATPKHFGVAPPPPCAERCRTEIWVWKGVALHGGVAATIAGVALHCATKFRFRVLCGIFLREIFGPATKSKCTKISGKIQSIFRQNFQKNKVLLRAASVLERCPHSIHTCPSSTSRAYKVGSHKWGGPSKPVQCQPFFGWIDSQEQIIRQDGAVTEPEAETGPSSEPISLKNILMPLFLMGCFPRDFQEGTQPIKAFGETAIRSENGPLPSYSKLLP